MYSRTCLPSFLSLSAHQQRSAQPQMASFLTQYAASASDIHTGITKNDVSKCALFIPRTWTAKRNRSALSYTEQHRTRVHASSVDGARIPAIAFSETATDVPREEVTISCPSTKLPNSSQQSSMVDIGKELLEDMQGSPWGSVVTLLSWVDRLLQASCAASLVADGQIHGEVANWDQASVKLHQDMAQYTDVACEDMECEVDDDLSTGWFTWWRYQGFSG
mmetsp:Transcript_23751/g.45171  ORF Transcript_23751/g.45171 Transcript_23751/m.45171 type:complete len:220 (-) Transcript_23751:269-928(-)